MSEQTERSGTLFLLQTSLSDKLPDSALPILRPSLERLSAEQLQALLLFELKNPIVGVVLHWFFGMVGVGRFYKGDVGLGILSIALFVGAFIVPFVIGMLMILNTSYDTPGKAFWACWLFAILLWCVFFIVEFVMIYKGIKQDNLKKISGFIENMR